MLLRLLKEATDPTVLAVATHDVGQYVKHYDRGKQSVLFTFMRFFLTIP
jgi:V-type H+-transporting ATPase subunit H